MSVSPGRVRCACARQRQASTQLTPLPFIPGLEGAGTLEAVAQDVRGLKVGDRVAYPGPTSANSQALPKRSLPHRATGPANRYFAETRG